jgi:hypothetical protein
MLKELREFILRGNLVDLAVAVVIGTAFTAVVTSLVKSLVTPLVAAVGGEALRLLHGRAGSLGVGAARRSGAARLYECATRGSSPTPARGRRGRGVHLSPHSPSHG